tara:strand:- start:195626 stop:196225 length:600 start_codon:yes stop_codon:yes gene_type:complete
MKLRLLKLTILFTLLSFSAFPIASLGQGVTDSALSMDGVANGEILSSVNKTLKNSLSEPVIRECIENTQKLEDIVKSRASSVNVLDYYKNVLQGHQNKLKKIKKTIVFFQRECDNYGDNCNSVNYHLDKLKKEYQEESNTKLEVVPYINEAIALKKQEESHRTSFDLNCQEQKFDKNQIIKLCREFYSYDFPICRDYML